jgi:hypothetical protein
LAGGTTGLTTRILPLEWWSPASAAYLAEFFEQATPDPGEEYLSEFLMIVPPE